MNTYSNTYRKHTQTLYFNFMDPITLTLLAAVGLTASIKLLIDKYMKMAKTKNAAIAIIETYSEEVQTVRQQMINSYQKEPYDYEMQDACRKVLRELCPQGIDKKFATLETIDERRDFMKELITRAANAIGVEIREIAICEGPQNIAGSYYYKDKDNNLLVKRIFINDLYLLVNPSIAISTLFHELRHAVQTESVYENNKWGVSAQRAAQWLCSNENYVNCTEAYALQYNEIDADLFAEQVMDLYTKKEEV